MSNIIRLSGRIDNHPRYIYKDNASSLMKFNLTTYEGQSIHVEFHSNKKRINAISNSHNFHAGIECTVHGELADHVWNDNGRKRHRKILYASIIEVLE